MKVTHPIFQLPDRNSFTHSSGMLPERATPPHIHTLRPLPPHLHSINHVAFFFFFDDTATAAARKIPEAEAFEWQGMAAGWPAPAIRSDVSGRPA
jgi:hypothetical protein